MIAGADKGVRALFDNGKGWEDMRAIALDIGTTKLCATLVDGDSGQVLHTLYEDNAFLFRRDPAEKWQDPREIAEKMSRLYTVLQERCAPVHCVGVTGQMHGFLYVDATGAPVSPLFTWQDQTSLRPRARGENCCHELERLCGYKVPAGYGLATYFYHRSEGLVPRCAVGMCTIQDYIASVITGERCSRIHSTNAASWGLYDLAAGDFDRAAAERANLDGVLLPQVVQGIQLMGTAPGGAPVYVGVGDHQAAFLGSVREPGNSIAVNLGTGGQLSIRSDSPASDGLEVRPDLDRGNLLTGSTLCGGRAYAILEGFFRQVLEMTGVEAPPLYESMDRLLELAGDREIIPRVDTRFAGTRESPGTHGSISGLSEENFTPGHLAWGVLEGMARELFELLPAAERSGRGVLVASGNAVRKNRHLREALGRVFGLPPRVPVCGEEAAYGAALLALTGVGQFPDLARARKIIRYTDEEQ